MIYFTADTHFHHTNIIKMGDRPFENIEEMNEALIDNWNSIVHKSDKIYILGDFLFRAKATRANEILRRLKGVKHLIKGNHDEYIKKPDFDLSLFEWIKDYEVISYKDARFILFHYPILEWEHYHRKSAHLYGHVHKNTSHIRSETPDKFAMMSERAINVGVEMNNYRPVSAEEIYERAFAKWSDL